MRLTLDHLAVVGATLRDAVAKVEETLGVPMSPGGAHPAMGTHNRLLSLGNKTYIEAIAIDPDAAPPAGPRWFGLDGFRGGARLAAWIVRGGLTDTLPEIIGPHRAISRGNLSWNITIREDGQLAYDGGLPSHIDWGDRGPAGSTLPPSGCRLLRFEVSHPDASAILSLWPALLTLRDVRIGPGPVPALRAEILTPHGLRFLE